MRTVSPRLVPPLAAALLATAAAAAEPASAGPAWETVAGASIGWDSNTYLAEFGPLANRESAVGTAFARIGAKFTSGLALSWSATATEFSDESDEDNLKQTLGASWTRKLDRLAWSAVTEFALVDGDDRGVDYGFGVGSAFSTAAPRERRDQWQNKTDLSLRHDTPAGFVRAVGKLQYWDMRTAAANGCNYVDRHDVQGGVDLGRSLGGTGPEVYLGYRRGHQFQDDDAAPAALAAPAGASNRYERALVGVDGSPVKSLKVAAQVGWTGHDYDAEYAGDAREEGVFTDAVLTWSVTKSDELQFKTGQARTISTTGKNSILSTTHQLSWKHTFNAAWTAALCGRLAEAEYAPFPRDDIDYTALASLTWNATDALACTLAFSQDWGRNHLNQLAGLAEARREFDRAFVSIGVNRRL